MGFEDSMIEDGFHDEEEYLEHLMDEAEEEWERQQSMQSLYRREEEEDFYEEYEDSYYDYDDLEKQYYNWKEENPLNYKLFVTWVNLNSNWNEIVDKSILEKFEEWKSNEELPNIQTYQIVVYYGDFYPHILDYFKWQIENPIEEMLRLPYVDKYNHSDDSLTISIIPENELLIERVLEFEEWLKKKKLFDKLFNIASEEKKKGFLQYVDEYELQNNTSIDHVRECLIEYMKLYGDDIYFDYGKILHWFDENNERGRELFYRILCINKFHSHPELLL